MFKIFIFTAFFCQAAIAHTSDQRVVEKKLAKLGLKSELSAIGDIRRKESAKLKLEFFDVNSKKRTAIKLKQAPELSLWMEMGNGKGHGSEKLKVKVSGNSYVISNAWFMMMGDWQLKAKISHNDKTSLETFPICIGRKPADSHVGKCK